MYTVNPDLVRNAAMSADTVAISHPGPNAAKTRAIIERAFEYAANNGLIVLVDPKDWPAITVLDPPYKI